MCVYIHIHTCVWSCVSAGIIQCAEILNKNLSLITEFISIIMCTQICQIFVISIAFTFYYGLKVIEVKHVTIHYNLTWKESTVPCVQ